MRETAGSVSLEVWRASEIVSERSHAFRFAVVSRYYPKERKRGFAEFDVGIYAVADVRLVMVAYFHILSDGFLGLDPGPSRTLIGSMLMNGEYGHAP